jgi:hypothetical protein
MKFDTFGVPLQMGVPVDGYYVRNLMQISSLLDDLLLQDKRLHITACGVPSSGQVEPFDAWGGKRSVSEAGRWRVDWSQQLQAEWMGAVLEIAKSKPHVESLCWADLADIPGQVIPHSGLCGPDMQPKAAYEKLRLYHTAGGETGENHTLDETQED